MTSPNFSNALNTRKALAAFRTQDSSTYTVMPNTLSFSPCALSTSIRSVSFSLISLHFSFSLPEVLSAAGAVAATGASFSALASFSSLLSISFKDLINSALSFVPSSVVCWILARYSSRASRQLKRISIISGCTLIVPFLTSENTFSISCVRFCIRLYPMVPAIPFRECAARNISLIVSMFSGSCSSSRICVFRFCKCSFVSSRKISRY